MSLLSYVVRRVYMHSVTELLGVQSFYRIHVVQSLRWHLYAAAHWQNWSAHEDERPLSELSNTVVTTANNARMLGSSVDEVKNVCEHETTQSLQVLVCSPCGFLN